MTGLSAFVSSVVLVSFSLIHYACSKASDIPRILVFTKTAGYYHESISDGVSALRKLGSDNDFDLDTTGNAELFTPEILNKYAAVIFLNTTGDVLNTDQQAAFERYIRSGGGYVGIHAAADTEYDWPWYGKLVGAYFLDHPHIQPAVLHVSERNFTATRHLPAQWIRTDEFYSFKNLNKDVKVLMTIDENSYQGGHKMGYHPMAWYHEYDGGRAFYTALGHTKESYQEEAFLKHIVGGILYAIGRN